MKKLLCLALCLGLTGCTPLREPTDMFVIAGAALTWQDGVYRMAGEMGDTTSPRQELPSSRVYTGTGTTVSGCLFDLAARVEREIYFGKTEVLLLEETMAADKRVEALDLFLAHRSDHQVLVCALRSADPERALSFGEPEHLRTSVIMGLLEDGARRVACRTLKAQTVRQLGDRPYVLPEITVDETGAVLSGAALYGENRYLGRLEGQPVRLLCLLLGSRVESACSFFGPDWAVWLKKASVERSGTTLGLTLETAFTEGDPTAAEAESFLETMGAELLATLRQTGCNALELPEFETADYRLAVTVHMP